MKRDVNYALMGLLLLTLISVVGLSAYYKYTFHDLGKRYEKARVEMEATYAELNRTQYELDERTRLLHEREEALEDKETKMDEYFSALDISRQRESSLGDMFNQIRTENALLAQQITDTQNELDKTIKDFSALTKNYNERTAEFTTMKNLFVQIGASLDYIEDRSEEMSYKVSDIEYAVSDLDDEIDKLSDSPVKGKISSEVQTIDASIYEISYALNKLQIKINDTDYYLSRIKGLE